MWWRILLFIIILTAVLFVIGLYAGGAMYLALTYGDWHKVSIYTLLNAGDFSLTNRQKIFLPWSWCITAALTFLPTAMTLIAMLGRGNTNSALHGNARFANNKELKAFKYKGNYQ
jgi:hypothetical protein